MDKETINSLILYLKQSLMENGVNVDSIALFGSAMTGRIDEGSDVDIIVISSDFNDLDIFERAKLTMRPETDTQRRFRVPMDILNLSPDEYKNSTMGLFYQSEIVA